MTSAEQDHIELQHLSDEQSRAVARAYDRAAERWHASRTELPPALRLLLDRMIADCPPRATVLDVGCGSGIPITRYLAERGCQMTGLDASGALLKIARRELPGGVFLRGDMRIAEPGGPFDAIVAWDTVFHVPRADHSAIFTRFAKWLQPRGVLLVSLGGSDWEGTSEMLGETFFYSGHEQDESLRLLREAGFHLMHSEIDDPSSRGHLAILARKETGHG